LPLRPRRANKAAQPPERAGVVEQVPERPRPDKVDKGAVAVAVAAVAVERKQQFLRVPHPGFQTGNQT
jgi:hypothetical protein